MGVAKTVISVAIIGNAKALLTTLDTADARMGGFLKGAAKGFIAFKAVDTAFDAVKSVLDNADRAGDALSRIKSIVGEIDAGKLDSIAGDFSAIGESRPDFLEIVAGFSEFAAASGKIDAATITEMAGGVAQFAGALGRLKDVDPATLGDDIANFISGSRGAAAAAKELALPFDSALTPAQRYSQLMERLPGLLNEVTGANAGLDDKQASLNAKWETFGSTIGPSVDDALSSILDILINIADDIPQLDRDMRNFFGALERGARGVLGPLGDVLDALTHIDTVGARAFQVSPGRTPRKESNTVRDLRDFNDRNGSSPTVRDRVGGE